jgi:hypothetical protein
LRRPLRDTHSFGYVAQTRVGVGRDAEQDMRVVGEERPVFDAGEPTTRPLLGKTSRRAPPDAVRLRA